MSEFTPTERTKVRRKPERANYDRETIYGILDQAFVCHVGFITDGMPVVVPTNYVRVGDKLFLHGSTASRLMKTLGSGAPFCLSVTLLDGIVFSPTATGHSVNYRSVVVMGKAEPLEDPPAGQVLRLDAGAKTTRRHAAGTANSMFNERHAKPQTAHQWIDAVRQLGLAVGELQACLAHRQTIGDADEEKGSGGRRP